MKLSLLLSIVFVIFYSTPSRAQDTLSVASPENNTSVAAELASFKLADGYQVELYASEQQGIAKPVAMRWDEQGRLWVLCTPLYPQLKPGEKPDDKLIIVEDRNKDGKADLSTVFADGLNMPLGFELGHGGVYLGEQSALLHLKDTSNDGRADTRNIVFSGFGTGDSHQTINSFTWSPGGDLYFSQGLSIYSRVETAEGVKKADRAAIWRYRPATAQLESFLDKSTASDNPWGMNFGNWGEMFIKGNANTVFFGTPGLAKTSYRAPLPAIGALEIKGAILEIVRTRHLPDSLQGDFILAGYYNSKVERMKVREDGSGFKTTLVEPLLTSSSRSFRPVDIQVGPDGAIYVLDWYNPIIGHYQASMRHPDRDKTHGRVWRITAKDRPLMKAPQLTEQSVPVLLDYLKSEEYWVRYQVRRLLAARPVDEIRPALNKWLTGLDPASATYEHDLMEAMAVCESHEWNHTELLDRLMKAKQSGARAYAAHVIGRWNKSLTNPLTLLEPLVNDPHPRTRLEALIACSYINQAQSIVVATQVLDHPMDKFLEYALEMTIHGLRTEWEPALQAEGIRFKKNGHLAKVISVTLPSWYTSGKLLELIKTDELSGDVHRILLVESAKSGKNTDIEFIFTHPSFRKDARILDMLSKTEAKPLPDKAITALHQLLATPSDEIKIAAIRLIKFWRIHSLTSPVNALVTNKNVPLSIRAESLETLVQLKGKQALPVLKELLNNSGTPLELRLASLQALSALDVGLAAHATVQEMMRSGKSVEAMLPVLAPIIDRRGGVQALTAELDKSSLSKEVARLATKALAIKGLDAPELQNRLNMLAAESVIVQRSYTPAYLNQLEREVKEKGNAAKGNLVYQSSSCSGCHKINGTGGILGPNLSAIGRGLSAREIIIEVLWPNQNIKEGYEKITVETKEGEIIEGNKVFENNEVVFIKTAMSKDNRKIAKTDVAKQTTHGSLMPQGLTSALSETQLRDLIRYLSELGNK